MCDAALLLTDIQLNKNFPNGLQQSNKVTVKIKRFHFAWFETIYNFSLCMCVALYGCEFVCVHVCSYAYVCACM